MSDAQDRLKPPADSPEEPKLEYARTRATEADARSMKMGDEGFRPAYNVHQATECAGQVIVGVEVVSAGIEMAQLAPMVAPMVGAMAGRRGFPAHAEIDPVAGKTELYSPMPRHKAAKNQDDDTDGNDGPREEQRLSI